MEADASVVEPEDAGRLPPAEPEAAGATVVAAAVLFDPELTLDVGSELSELVVEVAAASTADGVEAHGFAPTIVNSANVANGRISNFMVVGKKKSVFGK